MGLLTKEVEVNLTSRNIAYYEKLGYEIPRYYDVTGNKYKVKRGTTIFVNVSDLPQNSMWKVKIECDNCHSIINQPFESYNKYKKENGLYYCGTCSRKLFNSKENHPRWNSNKTNEERALRRNYFEYENFRMQVLKRDNYTCQCCNHQSTNLEVHHLDGYDWCKEKRTIVTNGITLCKNCHDNFHLMYGKGNNTKEQFDDWIGYIINLSNYNIEYTSCGKVYCLEDDIVFNSTNEAARYIGCDRKKITSCCNMKDYELKQPRINKTKTVDGKHFMWYDIYLSMTNEELQNYITFCDTLHETSGKNHYRAKKIICTTTNEVFDTITEAVEKYPSTNSSNITSVCKGKRKSAGKLSDGTKLKWMYYDDYIKEFREVS